MAPIEEQVYETTFISTGFDRWYDIIKYDEHILTIPSICFVNVLEDPSNINNFLGIVLVLN